MVQKTSAAVFSHGYVSPNDTKEVTLAKLAKLTKPHTGSRHKVTQLFDHLRDPKGSRKAFSATLESGPFAPGNRTEFGEMSKLVADLKDMYLGGRWI